MPDCDCQIERFDAVVFGGRVGAREIAASVGLATAPNEPNLPRGRLKHGGCETNEPNLARIPDRRGGSRARYSKARALHPGASPGPVGRGREEGQGQAASVNKSNEPNLARRGRKTRNPKLQIPKAFNGRKMNAEMSNEANFTIGKLVTAPGAQPYRPRRQPGGSLKRSLPMAILPSAALARIRRPRPSPGRADSTLPRATAPGPGHRYRERDADADEPAGGAALDNRAYSGYPSAVDFA